MVVVLNTGGIMDTEFFKDINATTKDAAGGTALDSLFLMSQAGQESGHALNDVLSGDVTRRPPAPPTDNCCHIEILRNATLSGPSCCTFPSLRPELVGMEQHRARRPHSLPHRREHASQEVGRGGMPGQVGEILLVRT